MTAAALKPDMFSHLFASRPEGMDKSSFTATALSVTFHATIVALVIWASTALTPDQATVIGEHEFPVVIATQAPPAPTQTPSSPTQSSSASAAAHSTIPTLRDIPDGIPAIDPTMPAIDQASDIAAPGPTTPGTPGAPAGSGDTPGGVTHEGFAVLSTMPALLNARHIQVELANRYPPLLRDAGIGGRAHLWVLLDETGRVERAKLIESSGHAALDEVAMKVAPMMRFSPAMNRDERVKVWVSVPVAFRAR